MYTGSDAMKVVDREGAADVAGGYITDGAKKDVR